MKILVVVLVTLFMNGCGTVQYVPEEYEIANDRVENLSIKGKVDVTNIQDDVTDKVFFGGSIKWTGNLKSVTEHLKFQLLKEVGENSELVSSNTGKTIEVKVLELSAKQHMFHFTSQMKLSYVLGNGKTDTLTVSQGSPGNMWRVLNGTIALGVIEILKDSKVRAYLES